jgi:hypothetical protein
MMLEVVLNIYSGRPNPQWTLNDTQETLFFAQLKNITQTTLTKPSGVVPKLGYRGFRVSRPVHSPQGPLSLLVQDQIVDFGQNDPNRLADNRELEVWLLDTAPTNVNLPPKVRSALINEINQAPINMASYLNARASGSNCPQCVAADAPLYNPGLWNVPNVQPYNNCYNYANDQITNTFAQPGRAHGVVPANIDCNDYQAAATADGLAIAAGFANPLAAGEGWYVALVVWPGVDFHWYRQDENGCWSHKPGSTPVTNLDNAGNLIADPAQCNMGNYAFCCYMTTNQNVVIQ